MIAFFFSILPGGVLHALNYERLGRPEYKLKSLTIHTLASLVVFLATMTELPQILFLMVNTCYAFCLQASQDALFKEHLARGGKKASLFLPGLASIFSLLPLLALVLGIVVAFECYRLYQKDEGFIELLETSHDYLDEQQRSLQEDFKIGQHERWDWSQETGKLILSNDGEPAVIASIQIVGSVSTMSDTWLWSWDNPSVADHLTVGSKKVRNFGLEHQYEKLTTPIWPAGEVDGWEMAAIAAYLVRAKGAYRTPGETGFTYLIIKDITWAGQQDDPKVNHTGS